MKKEARCGKPDQVHEAEVVNIGDSADLGTQQQESVSSPDAGHKLNIHSLPQSGASAGQWLPGDWAGAGVAASYCRYCHIYHSHGNYGKS